MSSEPSKTRAASGNCCQERVVEPLRWYIRDRREQGSHTILQISNFQSHEVRFLVSGFPAIRLLICSRR